MQAAPKKPSPAKTATNEAAWRSADRNRRRSELAGEPSASIVLRLSVVEVIKAHQQAFRASQLADIARICTEVTTSGWSWRLADLSMCIDAGLIQMPARYCKIAALAQKDGLFVNLVAKVVEFHSTLRLAYLSLAVLAACQHPCLLCLHMYQAVRSFYERVSVAAESYGCRPEDSSCALG